MATVKFINNILSEGCNNFSVDEGTSIEKIIRENVDENIYNETLVECYDLETGKTYYAPVDDDTDNLNAIILVNGKDAPLDYEVQENDIVNIIITPAGGGMDSVMGGLQSGQTGGWNWWGALGGFLYGTGVGSLYGLSGGWVGALIGGIVGGVIGFIAGGLGVGAIVNQYQQQQQQIQQNSSSKKGLDSEKLPDVRGASNQPLLNQPYPAVLGKHVTTPFIVGSPYNDISGLYGEENYINVLYVVGYGPLRLTDFKLGEQYIAHNQRWSGNPYLKNIWSGILHGTDSGAGSGSDTGEITNIWKNNDVSIEILQQTPGEPVNYGYIYPYAKLQNNIGASVLFIADGTLEEIDKGQNISYKGLGLQNGLRNNPIYFSEEFAKSVKVELDFPNGLYKSRSETEDNNSTTHYYRIPMWIAIQWRVYSEQNDKADGGNAGTVGIPSYDYNTQKYDLIDGKVKRGWNSFRSLNKVNMGWGDTSDAIYVDIKVLYVLEQSGIYNYHVKIESIRSSSTFSVGFDVTVKYKVYATEYELEYEYPERTGRKDIDEEISYLGTSPWVEVEVVPQGPGYKSGKGTRTSTGTISINVGVEFLSENYTSQKRTADFAAHTGNTLPDSLNSGWIDQKAFNLQELGATDTVHEGLNEFRITSEVDLWQWANDYLRAPGDTDEILTQKFKSYFYDSTNTTRSIEVRVVRISPNYLDETISTNEHSAFKFSDIFNWTTLTSTMLDGDKLLKENQIVQKRPLSEEDMRKLCVVALKAKTDNVDQLSNTIKKFSCVAESFAPYYDETQKKWFPENVKKKNKYLQFNNQTQKWYEITEQQYYEQRQAGNEKTKCLPAGNDFVHKLLTDVIDSPSHRDSGGRIFIPYNDMENGSYLPGCDGTMNYCCNNVASVFLYAGIGPHLGNDALGYSQNNYEQNGIGDFNMSSIAKWFVWAKKRTDGSTYTYSGYHYDHDGKEVPHEAGDIVEVYFTANAYLYQTDLVESILANIAIAGQAVYTRDTKNRLMIVIDKQEKYPVALINQKNTLKSSYTISFAELPSGIQVTFPDENDGYEQNQIYRMVDGEDEKDPFGAIEQYGFKYVTNNNQIWFLTGYLLANRILNKEVVTKQIGMEGASIALGDLVLVQDDTMLIGTDFGGRITQLIEDEFRIYGFIINDAFHMTGQENFGVVVMQPSKYKEYRVVTLRVADIGTTKVVDGVTYTALKGKTNTVLLRDNIAKSQFDQNGNDFYVIKPEVGNIVGFGTVNNITSKYRVVKIKPSEKQKYDLTLLKYTDDLYNCGAELPSFQNGMTVPDRSTENAFALSANTTFKDVTEAITEALNISYNNMVAAFSTIPSAPNNFVIKPERDYIILTCSIISREINNIAYVEYIITRPNGTQEIVKGTPTAYYYLERNFSEYSENYPEKEDFANWDFGARCVAMYTDNQGHSPTSATVPGTLDLSDYGTWIPKQPVVATPRVSHRTITLNFSQSEECYGDVCFLVSIQRYDEFRDQLPIWFKPDLNSDPYNSSFAYKDANATESFLKDGITYYYIETVSGITQTLPLEKQLAEMFLEVHRGGGELEKLKVILNGSSPEVELIALSDNVATQSIDTNYYYRIWCYNRTTERFSDLSNTVLVTAKATSAYDIVDSAIITNKLAEGAVTIDKLHANCITAEKLATRNLTAFGAFIGSIYGGQIDENKCIRAATWQSGTTYYLYNSVTGDYYVPVIQPTEQTFDQNQYYVLNPNYTKPLGRVDNFWKGLDSQYPEFRIGNDINAEVFELARGKTNTIAEYIHYLPVDTQYQYEYVDPDTQQDVSGSYTIPNGLYFKVANFIVTAISSIIKGLFYIKNKLSGRIFLRVNPATEEYVPPVGSSEPTTPAETMIVCGDVTIDRKTNNTAGNLSVAGSSTSGGNITAGGSMTSGVDLTVTRNASIGGGLGVTGNQTVGGTFTATGALTAGSLSTGGGLSAASASVSGGVSANNVSTNTLVLNGTNSFRISNIYFNSSNGILDITT